MNLSFLNPSLLWSLPLALGPLLIHLLFRKKPARREFSDLTLVRQAVERVQRSVKLRRYLLLLVRTLIVLLLVLFFSRPVLRLAAGGGDGSEAPAVVLLMDVSYSMECRDGAESRLEANREKARRILRLLPQRSRVGLVSYSDRVETATPMLGSDRSYVERMIDGCTASSRTTDIAPALRQAEQLLARSGSAGGAVIVLSDMAEHGFRGRPGDGIQRRVVAFTARSAENSFIEQAAARSDGAARQWRLECRVRSAQRSVTLPLSVFQKDRRIGSDFVRTAGGIGSVGFDAPGTDGDWCGRIVLSQDLLNADNTWYLVSRRPDDFGIWIVDGDPRFGGSSAESFYLRTVFPGAEVLPEAMAKDARFRLPGVVVLANVKEELPNVASFVESGGGAIVFPGSRYDGSGAPPYFPARVGSPFERSLGVRWKAAGDRLAKDFPADGFEWEKLVVEKGYVLSPDADALVLAEFANGWPFLVEGRCGRGRTVLCASAADREWSNLPGRPLFAPFLQSLARRESGCDEQAQGAMLTVGDTYRHAGLPSPEILLPDGTAGKITGGSDGILFSGTDTPGIYELRSAGRTADRFAVNLDRTRGEGELVVISRGKLREYFGESPVTLLPADNWENTLVSVLSGKEISRHLLLLVLLLMVGEMLLARGRKAGAVESERGKGMKM